jgi:chromosome transmission fidelity protein 8
MLSVSVFPRPPLSHRQTPLNPLPKVLQTPYGLALLEIQGTINFPTSDTDESTAGQQMSSDGADQEMPIGHLIFPGYSPDTEASSSTSRTKHVYLYVGKYQRLTGEVKKLPKAIAIIRKRVNGDGGGSGTTSMEMDDQAEELEIVDIVKWKIMFSQRPEPVGTWNGEG